MLSIPLARNNIFHSFAVDRSIGRNRTPAVKQCVDPMFCHRLISDKATATSGTDSPMAQGRYLN